MAIVTINVDGQDIEAQLQAILNEIRAHRQEMTMALSDLTAKVDALETALDNIRQDIVAIKASLPAEGGLTADEVTTLTTRLDGALARARALDDENPGATTPPEPAA